MASVLFDSCMLGIVKGEIALARDTFYLMLVTAAYVPDAAAHAARRDVYAESKGTGYTPGGAPTRATLASERGKLSVRFEPVTWPEATITARGGVLYRRGDGDPLVAYVDFGGDVASTNAPFVAAFSGPLTLTSEEG